MGKLKHEFSTEKFYMFGYNYYGGKPAEVIVEKPTLVKNDSGEILFHFMYGHHSIAEYIKSENIVAVGDSSGTVEVSGWSGKYVVLNQRLFDSYLKSGVVELKSLQH